MSFGDHAKKKPTAAAVGIFNVGAAGKARQQSLKQKDAYGRAHGVLSKHDGRLQLPCEHENHAGACVQAHLAEKCVSYLLLRCRAWPLAGLTVVGQANLA